MQALLLLLNLMGGLAVFLYGLRVMSEALQKAAGSRLRSMLRSATGNRFSATLTGFLTTCVVQSSTATTVMVVAFCSAGLLNLFQALGVIFGANIGTTTTGWLVSLIGFRVQVTAFALPAIGIGFFLQYLRAFPRAGKFGEVLMGFGMLFLGLELIKNGIPDMRDAPEVTAWLAAIEPTSLGSLLLVVLLGALLTVLFQSSSAVMVLTLTAAASGLIDYPTAAALVLGENIGTTVTANLAAVGAPTVARQAARGHFIFNVFGVLWAIALFGPVLALVDALLPGDPYATTEYALQVAIPTHVAAFHTFFNVVNTVLVLPLIRPLENLVQRLVWVDEDEGPELLFIKSTLTGTSELAIHAARHETDHMAGVVVKAMTRVKRAIRASAGKFAKMRDKVGKAEAKTDRLEHRINDFLTEVIQGELSQSATGEVLSLLDVTSELERMADHADKLVNLLARTREDQTPLSDEAVGELEQMAEACVEIAEEMRKTILDPDPRRVPAAKAREQALNDMRNRFRQAHNRRLAEGSCSADAGIAFADMLTSFERFGDHGMKVIYGAVGNKEVLAPPKASRGGGSAGGPPVAAKAQAAGSSAQKATSSGT